MPISPIYIWGEMWVRNRAGSYAYEKAAWGYSLQQIKDTWKRGRAAPWGGGRWSLWIFLAAGKISPPSVPLHPSPSSLPPFTHTNTHTHTHTHTHTRPPNRTPAHFHPPVYIGGRKCRGGYARMHAHAYTRKESHEIGLFLAANKRYLER